MDLMERLAIPLVPARLHLARRHAKQEAPTLQHADLHLVAPRGESAVRSHYAVAPARRRVACDVGGDEAVRAAVHDFRAARYATGAAPPLLPVPVDHVTSCAPQWGTPQALTIHRLSVAWWTKG